MRRLLGMWGALAVLVLESQFALGQYGQPPATPNYNGRTFLLVANGPNDFNSLSENLQRVFESIPGQAPIIRPVNWTRPDTSGLEEYSSRDAHMLGAALMSYDAQRIHRLYPNSPIYLMGYGAGACVTLSAAEQLPPGSVERIVLLSPSVSSNYDIRHAARASRQGMDVFFHTEDSVLEFKESEFGTADGQKGATAGRTGFTIARNRNALAADPILASIRQHDISAINGGHLAAVRTSFLRARVAPLLTSTETRGSTVPPPVFSPSNRMPSPPPALIAPPQLPNPGLTKTTPNAPTMLPPSLPPSLPPALPPSLPQTNHVQAVPSPAPPQLPVLPPPADAEVPFPRLPPPVR